MATIEKDSFKENATILRKIINENIFFGSDAKEQALEFLEAMIKDHEQDVLTLVFKAVSLEEDLNSQEEEEPDEVYEESFIRLDYGLGVLKFDCEVNLKFLEALEIFVENFKTGNA